MSATQTLRRSPLHDWHTLAGGRIIDFHGWELPVQYSSVMDEHQATRKAAGIFDISHMGQVLITGPKALDCLQPLMTGDLKRGLERGIGIYGHVLRDNGGVIDDIFVYPRNAHELFVVVNSATHAKDVQWFREHALNGASIIDLENRGALAIQGPKALAIVKSVVAGIAELPRFAFQRISGSDPHDSFWACRTGYTGEAGVEFFGPAATIIALWKQLIEQGQSEGLKPCGLGARDTLRLEVGYPLYGHELTEDKTSLESNMEWAVKWAKGDFIGRAALESQKRKGLSQLLLAYELLDRGVPRQGAKIYKEGTFGGETTSGTFSPSLQKGIGLAFAPVAWQKPGTRIEVEIHGKKVPAQIVNIPFYKPT